MARSMFSSLTSMLGGTKKRKKMTAGDWQAKAELSSAKAKLMQHGPKLQSEMKKWAQEKKAAGALARAMKTPEARANFHAASAKHAAAKAEHMMYREQVRAMSPRRKSAS